MSFFSNNKEKVPTNTNNNSAPRTTSQTSIPYVEVYRENGMIQSTPGTFSVTWRLPEVPFKTLSDEEQNAFFDRFKEYLNSIDSTEHVQFTILNTLDDIDIRFAKVSLKEKGDTNDEYRKEMNSVIKDNMTKSRGSIVTKKYVTYSITAPSVDIAATRFKEIDTKIIKAFRAFIGKEPEQLTLDEKLELLATIYGTDDSVYFVHDLEGKTHFDWENMSKFNMTTKDVIAPDCLSFKTSSCQIGEYSAQSLYLHGLANFLSTDFIGNLADINSKMVMSIDIYPIEQVEAIKLLHNKAVVVNTEISTAQQNAVKKGYSPELVSRDLMEVKEQIENLQRDMSSNDEKIFYMQLNLTHFAKDDEELKFNSEEIKSVASRNLCNFRPYVMQQENGFNACLPLGVNHTYVKRPLTTEAMAAFMPFTEISTFDENGFYYGVNAINKSVIILDRKTGMNYNGIVFGASGSGKSFASKREMTNVILNSDDDIFIIDPDNEYSELAHAYGGSVIPIAPGNGKYINPFDLDINNEFDKENNPLSLQVDFIIGLVETIKNSGHGRAYMTSAEESVLNRCINNLYKGYMEHLNSAPTVMKNGREIKRTIDREAAPTLQGLFQELIKQPEIEGRTLSLDIESYVSGNYDTFAHRTNVDIDNRLTVFDISEIGNKLKEVGLQVCLNLIWNKVVENRKKHKNTWVYIDEFHLLLKNPTSADFICSMWKRARKFGCGLTGITQNPEDVLNSPSARSIMSNTNFVLMLNQSAMDADALGHLLTLSPNELQYITNVERGRGLIKFSGSSIPFKDNFPKDTKLYEIMSTDPNEKRKKQQNN